MQALGRLVDAADFKRLLATPMRSRSAHFAVHHLSALPARPRWPRIHPPSTDLSTGASPIGGEGVDNPPQGHWLGCVVGKRHARRAVTRNLLRRQIRATMSEQLMQLPPGLWLVRLRAPFAPGDFPAAASLALRRAVRMELQQLFAGAVAAPRLARAATAARAARP